MGKLKILFGAAMLFPLVATVPIAPVCAAEGCCKTCKKGKACGDSCIAKDATCKKGKGCACNG